MEKIEVKEAKGKLGILVVGVGGAVATTMITGNPKRTAGFVSSCQ